MVLVNVFFSLARRVTSIHLLRVARYWTLVSKETGLYLYKSEPQMMLVKLRTKINSSGDRNAMLAELDRLKVHVEGLNHLWGMVVCSVRINF